MKNILQKANLMDMIDIENNRRNESSGYDWIEYIKIQDYALQRILLIEYFCMYKGTILSI